MSPVEYARVIASIAKAEVKNEEFLKRCFKKLKEDLRTCTKDAERRALLVAMTTGGSKSIWRMAKRYYGCGGRELRRSIRRVAREGATDQAIPNKAPKGSIMTFFTKKKV